MKCKIKLPLSLGTSILKKITTWVNLPFIFITLCVFIFARNLFIYYFIFVAIYNAFYFLFRNRTLIKMFSRFSLLLCGKKGTGKDVIFSYAYNSISAKKHPKFSNIPYDNNFHPVSFSDFALSCSPDELINSNDLSSVLKTNYRPEFENSICFMSDTGVYLSSANFAKLNYKYPSLPIYIALNRQLYKQNIHCNTQAFNRVWDKYREQFDFYINIRSSFLGKISRSLFTFIPCYKIKLDMYSNVEDAVSGIIPQKKKKDNNTALVKGRIKTMCVCVPLYKIKHDTRYFKKLLK